MRVRAQLLDGSLTQNLADQPDYQQKNAQRQESLRKKKKKNEKKKEETKEKETGEGKKEGLRLTVAKNGVRKVVVLKSRDLAELNKAVKDKFRTKPAKITTPDGKEVTQLVLDTLSNECVLTVP